MPTTFLVRIQPNPVYLFPYILISFASDADHSVINTSVIILMINESIVSGDYDEAR